MKKSQKNTIKILINKVLSVLKRINLRGIIDLLISAFFKIFVPITYVAFILAGLFSALVSGLIEYKVFAELFPKDMQNDTMLLFSIPFLIVVSFEVTKVFLIFLDKAYQQSKNEIYLENQVYFRSLRVVLIAVSIVSTLLFSFYNLHNPEYGNVLSKVSQEIEKDFDKQIELLNANYDKQIKQQIEPLNQEIATYNGRMKTEEGFKFQGRQEFRGPRYEEAKRLRKETEDRREQVIIAINNLRNKDIAKLNDEKNRRIEENKNELKTSSASGNKMLSATLQVVNMDSEFPQIQYILIIAFFSLLLSFGLEYIIWAAFTVLAINHTNIFISKIMEQPDYDDDISE